MQQRQKMIVAEVSKTWTSADHVKKVDTRTTLSGQFERVIEVNLERGYHLQSWRMSQIMTGPEVMTETIIAVFKLDPLSRWDRSDEPATVEGASGVKDATEATELDRRIYYQNIVYDVCNALDRIFSKRPGRGVVCGTVENPSSQVQELMPEVIQRCDHWAKLMCQANGPDGPAKGGESPC